jgi:putative hydrolase of the HAD superfamily
MRLYQHYSFDLWMTLIRSNPSYKPERARLIQKRYNPARKSLEEVEAVFRKVDLLANSINEKTGGQLQAEELFLLIIGLLSEDALADVDPKRLYEEMEAVALAHPPLLYGPETLPALHRLRELVPEATFGILSNTAFIKGRTLKKILPGLGLGDLFAFQCYSDEAGLSKPNPALFRLMLDALPDGQRSRVVHIGDNPIADVAGAEAAGIASILINSNHQRIDQQLFPS